MATSKHCHLSLSFAWRGSAGPTLENAGNTLPFNSTLEINTRFEKNIKVKTILNGVHFENKN